MSFCLPLLCLSICSLLLSVSLPFLCLCVSSLSMSLRLFPSFVSVFLSFLCLCLFLSSVSMCLFPCSVSQWSRCVSTTRCQRQQLSATPASRSTLSQSWHWDALGASYTSNRWWTYMDMYTWTHTHNCIHTHTDPPTHAHTLVMHTPTFTLTGSSQWWGEVPSKIKVGMEIWGGYETIQSEARDKLCNSTMLPPLWMCSLYLYVCTSHTEFLLVSADFMPSSLMKQSCDCHVTFVPTSQCCVRGVSSPSHTHTHTHTHTAHAGWASFRHGHCQTGPLSLHLTQLTCSKPLHLIGYSV